MNKLLLICFICLIFYLNSCSNKTNNVKNINNFELNLILDSTIEFSLLKNDIFELTKAELVDTLKKKAYRFTKFNFYFYNNKNKELYSLDLSISTNFLTKFFGTRKLSAINKDIQQVFNSEINKFEKFFEKNKSLIKSNEINNISTLKNTLIFNIINDS